MLVFSTHTFTEGDGIFESDAEPGAHFNSRLHGRRPITLASSGAMRHFNSRLHGRRQPGVYKVNDTELFQLTPSRKATAHYSFQQFQIDISTHAFTEGDGCCSCLFSVSGISTHAFTEGDRAFGGFRDPVHYFNSRLHGRRHPRFSQFHQPGQISTHAFTEGDDSQSRKSGGSGISTHAFTEGDRVSNKEVWGHWEFQLTPSRKATNTWITQVMPESYFNSRLHGRRHQ